MCTQPLIIYVQHEISPNKTVKSFVVNMLPIVKKTPKAFLLHKACFGNWKNNSSYVSLFSPLSYFYIFWPNGYSYSLYATDSLYRVRHTNLWIYITAMILYVAHKAWCQSNVEVWFFFPAAVNGTNEWAHRQAAMSSSNFGS